MALPSLSWLARVGQYCVTGIPALGALVAFSSWLFGFAETLAVAGIEYINQRIGVLDVAFLGGADFSVVDGIAYINAMFPLSEALTIYTTLATACLTVAVVRWIKSFIPTVSN